MSKIQEALNYIVGPRPSFHIFLCLDQSAPKCAGALDSLTSWNYLKNRLVELNLHKQVLRSKASCLRLCREGPIMVVYPTGTWYRSCSPEVIERIIQEHIIKGIELEEFKIGTHPLSGSL